MADFGWAANDHFGASIAADNNALVFGSPGSSSPYVFACPSSFQNCKTLRPNSGDGSAGDGFGQSVAVSGNKIVVGAPLDDNAKGTDAGAAYVFVRDNNGNWTQQQKLIASDGITRDQFGQSVSIQGNTIVV